MTPQERMNPLHVAAVILTMAGAWLTLDVGNCNGSHFSAGSNLNDGYNGMNSLQSEFLENRGLDASLVSSFQ